ncbi:hypothetical protein [Salirhabdus salicampi]|uniref:hypothetical protein n=1 Tax=Salirhabdus salicampi TaxID=476102 RepID=UPI0020C4D17A|nr:hypothetical protein [Salirhabdus salicampi]MCP8615997.1 hypothetical protein [Salirhabdus salicampi]
MKEDQIKAYIDQLIEDRVREYVDQMLGPITNDLRNENGNSTVKQSGNGIVYVDNTGIAYALVLFFQYMIGDKMKTNLDAETLMTRLEKQMEDNRNMFEGLIKSLQNGEKED